MTTVLHGLPRKFKQEALLRVEPGGFPRRNPKELGVKLVDTRKNTGGERHAAARFRATRMRQGVNRPTVAADGSDEVASRGQCAPECGFVTQVSGKTKRHPDNGDSVSAARVNPAFQAQSSISTALAREPPPGAAAINHPVAPAAYDLGTTPCLPYWFWVRGSILSRRPNGAREIANRQPPRQQGLEWPKNSNSRSRPWTTLSFRL